MKKYMKGLEVAHWYHIFGSGHWREAVAEHMAALEDAKFDGFFGVGVVADSPEVREQVWTELEVLRPPDVIAWFDERLGAGHDPGCCTSTPERTTARSSTRTRRALRMSASSRTNGVAA